YTRNLPALLSTVLRLSRVEAHIHGCVLPRPRKSITPTTTTTGWYVIARYAAMASAIAAETPDPSSAGRRQRERARVGGCTTGGGGGGGGGCSIFSAIACTSLPNSSSAWSPVQPTSRAACMRRNSNGTI